MTSGWLWLVRKRCTTGKTNNRELLTIGGEELYNDPARFATKDPEYCAFVIGLLSGQIRGGVE